MEDQKPKPKRRKVRPFSKVDQPGIDESMQVSLALAPLDSTDMGFVRAWRNDYRIWKWCRQNDLISDMQQSRWFTQLGTDPTTKMYKIVMELKTGSKSCIKAIGVCGYTSIDLRHRRAEFNFYIAPTYQGIGLGEKAMCLLLDHGFKNLGFHTIWGEVFEENHALDLFKKVGFEVVGRLREAYFRDGHFVDAHIIDMKDFEWILRQSSLQ